MRMKWTLLLGVAFAGLTALVAMAADEPAKADSKVLIVTDNGGKEHKLKTWKFTAGTRHLAWLAAAEKEPEPKEKPEAKETAQRKAPPREKAAPGGPEALEFREENSTNFKDGILTFVLLDRLRSLEYDNKDEKVTLTAATGDPNNKEVTLTGWTKFVGSNKITIEAEVDKGDLGIAEVKFLGGVAKGVNAIKFPAGAEIKAAPEGRSAFITAPSEAKEKSTHDVRDLQALYRVAEGQVLSPFLFFKKTIKVDLAKVGKITVTKSGNDTAWGLSMKAGGEESLTLLTTVTLDGKPAVLEGFVGRVPAGYKLFPVHTIEEVQFDEKPKKFDASNRRELLAEPLGK